MKIQRVVSTKLDSGEMFTATIEIDYSGVDQQAILEWATSNRVIAFQRSLRKLTRDECRELANGGNVITVHAASAGHKIESESERINRLVGMGIPRTVAELAIRNPDALAKITAENDDNDETETESE